MQLPIPVTEAATARRQGSHRIRARPGRTHAAHVHVQREAHHRPAGGPDAGPGALYDHGTRGQRGAGRGFVAAAATAVAACCCRRRWLLLPKPLLLLLLPVPVQTPFTLLLLRMQIIACACTVVLWSVLRPCVAGRWHPQRLESAARARNCCPPPFTVALLPPTTYPTCTLTLWQRQATGGTITREATRWSPTHPPPPPRHRRTPKSQRPLR